ncbi:MAG: STAS domain-containing protein [Desulfobacteraceae bacterium]|nr:STAS domain-containing protein [Desulfobacteraceae bacterium]MBC2752560.1 STAS domain-containing protein [Desulfobacteraceae bacterium]
MTLLVSSRQKALGAYVVTLTGELNGKTYPVLENKLDQMLEERPTVIVLDMAEVNYLSSAGIRVILKTKKMLATYNGKLVFINLQPQIKKVFEIINALPSMRVFKDLNEMDDYLDRMQRKVSDASDQDF